MSFRTFIFDFDGTLCDSFEASLKILGDLSRRHGFRMVEPAELEAMRTQPVRQIVRRMGVPPHKIPWLVREARLAMAERLHELRPFDGFGNILTELGRRGAHRWVVTSNSTTTVHSFASSNGLDIDKVFGNAPLFGKGMRLRRAMAHLGRNERAIYIGDELRDIEAARTAGIPCGVVSWGFNAVEAMLPLRPDFVFRVPEEILALA